MPHALSEQVVPFCVLGTLATLVSAVSSKQEFQGALLATPPCAVAWNLYR